MEQQFSLSWNNFHGNLSKGFAGLLGKGEFVDVTIAVDGHLLQAHKVILSICSPYFKKMFQMNPCQHPIVVLRDITHKAMKDLLQFMYHGEVSVKREDLTSFIGTAEVLQIKGLTNKEAEDVLEQGNKLIEETPKQTSETASSPFILHEEMKIPENEVLQRQDFIEKLQSLSNLKRKSDEFLQRKYYTDILSTAKRLKVKEKSVSNTLKSPLQLNNVDNMRPLCEDNPSDLTLKGNSQSLNNFSTTVNNAMNDHSNNDATLEVKTECDDSDITITDPVISTSPKHFDVSKDTLRPMEFQSTQDNGSSLNSLFIDLKNLVNGKMIYKNMGLTEEISRPVIEHRLITIPQKEDGKKKYPQRSCRLCWKIGKRRDTRFMCNACELPFCKSPCFEIHFNDVQKLCQLQGDYYAT